MQSLQRKPYPNRSLGSPPSKSAVFLIVNLPDYFCAEQKEIPIPKYTPRYTPRSNSRISLSTMAEMGPTSRYPSSSMSKTRSISNLSMMSGTSRSSRMSKSKSTMNLSKASSIFYIRELIMNRFNYHTPTGTLPSAVQNAHPARMKPHRLGIAKVSRKK